jgi:hypothetical protein
MQKTAQKRSILNKLREMTNVSGIAAEKVFSPEFQELMTRLRDETDDPVRAIITGDQIGDATPPADGMSLKALLSSAKSNLNRREYMKAVSDLGRFHKKMYDVVKLLGAFTSNVDKVHEKFLFEGLDEESKQHLHDLKGRLTPPKSASFQPYFIKSANILDFFANIGTERGRALGAWEKRYPKQVGKLKKDTATMVGQSEKLLSSVLSSLKEMASARAVRNPDKYIVASSKIINAYNNYDKLFKSYYESNVKGFLEKQELIPAPKVDVSDKPAELGNQDVVPDLEVSSPVVAPRSEDVSVHPEPVYPITNPVGPPSNMDSGGNSSMPIPLVQPRMDTLPSAGNTNVPPPESKPSSIKMTPAEMKAFEGEHLGTETHKKFYESLSKMSGESPLLLASYIKKYAKSIEASDPVVAINLFKVANRIGR